ncbi:MAG: hypothetical protein AAB296_06600, partial [Candidatus Desantisbacteria bacterium]
MGSQWAGPGSETIQIGFGKTITITTTTVITNSNKSKEAGSFSTQFTVDTQCFGTKVITAHGLTSSFEDTTEVLFITGQISERRPTEGPVGQVVTVFGTGYIAEEPIYIDFGKTKTIATTLSGIYGTFSATFTVDTLPKDVWIITARSGTSSLTNTTNFTILPKIAILTPDSGVVSTSLTITGTGFKASENIKFNFGTHVNIVPLPGIPGNSDGTFSTTFTIDTQPYGSTQIKAVNSIDASVFATTTFVIIQEIASLQPASGPVGTNITLTITGYTYYTGSSNLISIDFAAQQTITSATLSANGSAVFSFDVDNQPAGPRVITARESLSNRLDTTVFYVSTGISIIPTQGPVGTKVTLSGNGFGTETLQIDFGTHQTITTTQAQGGVFLVTFLIDTQPIGTQGVTVTGLTYYGKSYISFCILPEIIIVNPGEGVVNQLITVEGTGFGGSETIRIDFGNTNSITTSLTSTNGTFSTTFLVNTQKYSTKTITATGSAYSFDIETDTFAIKPDIAQVIPQFGVVGTKVTLIGTGYENGEEVGIDFGTHQTITTTIASSNGTFSTTFVVDTQPIGTSSTPGDFNIVGRGILSESAKNWFYIEPNTILVTPSSGPVGTKVTVEGTGYDYGEKIWISFGTLDIGEPITSVWPSINGTFSASFIVNTQPIGTTIITAIVGSGGYPPAGHQGEKSATVFIITPKITIVNPSRGVVDTVVTVEGTGFAGAGNTEVIKINFGTHETITTTTTSLNGTFSVTFIVDTQPALTRVITATGLNSIITLSYGFATNTFFIEAEITLITPSTDVVGEVATLIGEGYGANEEVRIDFGTHKTITTTIASGNGTFSTTFIISTQEWGTRVVTAQGNASQNLDTTTFLIESDLVFIDRPEGYVSEPITIKGTGYKAIEVLTIHFGTKQ